MPAYLTLARVARTLPGRDGEKNISPVTIARWVTHGVIRPGTDDRIKLKAIRLGGRWGVTQDDLDAFISALSPAPSPSTPPRTPGQRAKASQRALQELRARGI
jgi:hypothetical protein